MRDGSTKWQALLLQQCKDEPVRGHREQQLRRSDTPHNKMKQIGHHARPKRASATALLRTGAAILQDVRSTVNQQTPFGTAGVKCSCCVLRLSDQA